MNEPTIDELRESWNTAARRTTHAESWAYSHVPQLFRLIGELKLRNKSLEAELDARPVVYSRNYEDWQAATPDTQSVPAVLDTTAVKP